MHKISNKINTFEKKVNDINWRIFRMQFGEFIVEGSSGRLTFCHLHFKEAVQTLLLGMKDFF